MKWILLPLLMGQTFEVRKAADMPPMPSFVIEAGQPTPSAMPPQVRNTSARLRSPLLTTARKEKLFRSFWPKSKEPALQRLKDDDLIWYDEDDMPRIYQVFDMGNRSGFLRADSGQATANNEFPWVGPAGTVAGSNFKAVRFVKLPGPIRWWRGQYIDDTFARFRWEYPADTTFGEILLVTDPSGFDHTFELRTRTKGQDGKWNVQAYRPFPTEESFKESLAERGFRADLGPGEARSVRSEHEANAFASTGLKVNLPVMGNDLVKDLLGSTDFQASNGKVWRSEGQHTAGSPSTNEEFSIVPKGFLGAFIPVDSTSCMRCHQDAGKVVNLQGESRWRLRGDDSIFSFHLWDKDSIGSGQGAKWNQKLIGAGLLAHKEGMP